MQVAFSPFLLDIPEVNFMCKNQTKTPLATIMVSGIFVVLFTLFLLLTVRHGDPNPNRSSLVISGKASISLLLINTAIWIVLYTKGKKEEISFRWWVYPTLSIAHVIGTLAFIVIWGAFFPII